MDKETLLRAVTAYVNTTAGNFIGEDIALRADLKGMQVFEEPLMGFAKSEDEYFARLKSPEVIGPHFIMPGEWLPGAKTVISLFLPFTMRVKKANRIGRNWPAKEWLHARIEGQAFIADLCRSIQKQLAEEGFRSVVPLLDERFATGNPKIQDKTQQGYYTSNWSERHVAHGCGLGTFGLSGGLITRKGIAGRYASLITDAPFEPSPRPYTGAYDYCIRCGACVRNCPVQAISQVQGKRHPICSKFLDLTREKYQPRYGCGKCQVNVPCENGIPGYSR
ncbi:MAG: 4Fe-4S binding protein [Treponema sp.]|jgi:epoxyqueuosine reductase QueG|nr:4Fe-4S binding protein [Treponema sp.]